MAHVDNVDGKPVIVATGQNLDEAYGSEVKNVKRNYTNKSGPRLGNKKRAEFIRLVNEDADMSSYKLLGFDTKKQVKTKIRMLRKNGYISVTPDGIASTRPKTERSGSSNDYLEAAATIRAIEILDEVKQTLIETLPEHMRKSV